MERKRAIEILRKEYDPRGCDETLRKALETLIPELRESEDERIRKFLVNLVNDGLTCFPGSLMRSDVLTYLEKQKESTWTEEDESFRKYILPRILDPKGWTMEQIEADKKRLEEFVEHQKNKWLEKQKTYKPTDEDERIRKELIDILEKSYEFGGFTLNNKKDLDRYVAYLEKQKEQKPVDDKAFEEWLDDWYQGSKEAGGDVVMSESEFKNWSRGIRNMYEQKPAEWSEEDEDMFVSVLHFLNTNRINERGKVITWVESLPKRFSLQPKQEWSEGDERMLKSTIWHISNSVTNGKNTDCKCDLTEWLKEKLKSLRPSWKPSEEQMEALRKASDLLVSDLNSLYNDLKKLM